MSYCVEFNAAAARQIKKLPRPARDRVLDSELVVTVVRTGHRREIYDR